MNTSMKNVVFGNGSGQERKTHTQNKSLKTKGEQRWRNVFELLTGNIRRKIWGLRITSKKG